DMMIGLG
ncbi:nad5, partial [Olea europaea subsp. europaea]